MQLKLKDYEYIISIHAPLAGCDRASRTRWAFSTNFNPRTPCGVRPDKSEDDTEDFRHFNPRTPCGVRREKILIFAGGGKFQSTHPLRGATFITSSMQNVYKISIHAPLAGCDFYPHTRPLSGLHFNPRTPCGVRHVTLPPPVSCLTFQSTHPLRGATTVPRKALWVRLISIHAPLAGCDHSARLTGRQPNNFNPRTPCGVRLDSKFQRFVLSDFNPRTPCGVRPEYKKKTDDMGNISIHAPLAGCDGNKTTGRTGKKNFNPRTPCGVRRVHGRLFNKRFGFQSTHPLRGATIRTDVKQPDDMHFNPRTPCGVRRVHGRLFNKRFGISIHAPLAGCD